VKLNTIRDWESMPPEREIVVVGDGIICTETQGGRQRERNLPLQGITGHIAHLALDGLETLPLALSDLDGQQLEQMPITVGRTGARALRPIE
jgi:hypothetical protein